MLWISSTENKQWQEEENFINEKGIEIVIGAEKGKPIYGFGACFSELGIKAISSLDGEKRRAVYDDFFGKDGCGFSFCRLPVGANDFAESWYSYNEVENDFSMEHFSIDRDKKYLIPAIKEAQERCPELSLFASPWSPPTWMKFPKVYNYGKFIMTDENLKAYALYFKKYLEAYEAEGIHISQLHVQNEIFANQKFPSCVWSGEDLRKFISEYLIDEVGDKTEIWFGTINGPEMGQLMLTTRHNGFLNLIMQDPKCAKNISGASYQWAGKFGILQAEEDYPELNLINSEVECGEGKNTWDYAMYSFEMYRHYFAHGARACTYWNMALDERKMSSWGWSQNSLINVINGEVVYNPDYYMVKHFSHFVKRGAVMLETRGHFNTNTAVFKNPNGERVAVIMNPFDKNKTVTIEGKNFVLKPCSFNSIIL